MALMQKKVINKFTSIFATFGLPDVLVTDGGPPFNAQAFISFMQRQGIIVMKSPPYNPSSNGQAERMVRTTKDIFKKFMLYTQLKSLDIEDKIKYFLVNYRTSTTTSDDFIPAERIFLFKPKTLLDLLHPKSCFKQHLDKPQKEAMETVKKTMVECSTPPPDPFEKLLLGDKLYYRNPNKGEIEKWIEAKFVKRVSPNVFLISFGRPTINAHRNQIKLVTSNRRISKFVVPLPSRKRRREVLDSDEEEEFLGFPDVPERPYETHRKRAKLSSTNVPRSPIRTRSVSRSLQVPTNDADFPKSSEQHD